MPHRLPYASAHSCRKCGTTRVVPAGAVRKCLPCKNAWQNEWRRGHPERRGNPGKSGQRTPEANRKWCQVRFAWLRAGDCTSSDLRNIYSAARGLCAYCAVLVERPRFARLSPSGFDHVIPRSLGGRHTPSNIVVACTSCNRRKSAIHPNTFAPGLLARLAGTEATR